MADMRHFTTEPAPGERIRIDLPDALERAKQEAPTPEIRSHAIDLIENGYTVIPGCVPPRDREAAVTGFRSWCERRSEVVLKHRAEQGRLPRIMNLHCDVPELLPLFSHNERALAVQDFCFGYRTSAYTSLFYETGSQQSLHRDVPYFCTEPEHFFFGMWVALEDVDLDNGPLLIVPGSHRLQSADPHALGAARRRRGLDIPPVCRELWNEYQTSVQERCRQAKLSAGPLQVSAGDTVVWHPLAFHGGTSISDPGRTRMSIVFHTTPEGVPVYQGDVFFDGNASPSRTSLYDYKSMSGRSFVSWHSVAFG